MTAGASGTYAINGSNFTLQPTTGQWLPRELRGYDGNGRPVYSALRQFEIRWGYMSATNFNQIKTFYDSMGATGTVVVDLPQFGTTPYQFYSYSGCHVSEPEMGVFFNEHESEILMVVTGIRT